MDKELLLKVKEQILKEPRQFTMGRYFEHRAEVPNCGTVACIAGWAIALKNQCTPEDASRLSPNSYEAEGIAALQITKSQSQRLFYADRWMGGFFDKYYRTNTPEERAQVAADYIDYFIENEL